MTLEFFLPGCSASNWAAATAIWASLLLSRAGSSAAASESTAIRPRNAAIFATGFCAAP